MLPFSETSWESIKLCISRKLEGICGLFCVRSGHRNHLSGDRSALAPWAEQTKGIAGLLFFVFLPAGVEMNCWSFRFFLCSFPILLSLFFSNFALGVFFFNSFLYSSQFYLNFPKFFISVYKFSNQSIWSLIFKSAQGCKLNLKFQFLPIWIPNFLVLIVQINSDIWKFRNLKIH